MNTSTKNLEQLLNEPYKYGFSTNIKMEAIEKGLNEKIIHLISYKKEEPSFMLKFRLKAFEKWKKMNEPEWSFLNYKKPNYQEIRYYSAPTKKKKNK
jgi:Fe-S cluster assembly protein SufB